MITNEEMKKVFEFKLLTGKEFMLLTYIDINNFKNLDIKLLAYETDTLKYDLIKYLENLKNKGFLKEDSDGVHTTFTPYQFEKVKIKSKPKKTTKVKKEVNIDIIENYFENNEVNNSFNEFLIIRKDMKVKNTELAINRLINELNKYDDSTKIEMLNNSIMNGWKGVFPLKRNNGNTTNTKKEITKDYLDSL